MIRALPFLLLLSACSDFPEVGRAEAKLATSATTPALLTAEEMAALGLQPSTDQSAALAAEAARLRARANALRRR